MGKNKKEKCEVHGYIWRLLLLVIGVLGMLVFIYPVFRGSRVNIGTILGMGVFGLITLYVVFKKKIDGLFRRIWKRKVGKICLTAVMVIAAGGLSSFR